MKLYRIRIHPEHAPGVYRVLEFAARHTLLDVHAAIQRVFELDDDHAHAFYMSGRHWDARTAVKGPVPGARGQTPRTHLYELGLEPGRRFAYLFDLGDELWHQLEVQAITETSEPPDEPRMIESVGEAPPQYPDVESEGAPDVGWLLPMAQELVALFPLRDDDADGGERTEPRDESGGGEDLDADEGPGGGDQLALDDDFDDEARFPPRLSALALDTDSVLAARALASKLASDLDGDEARFSALEDAVGAPLVDLLADLPKALAAIGLVDAAAELAAQLGFIEPAHFLGERALILAEAGRREDALAQLEQNLAAFGDDLWVEINAADTYARLGEAERAEQMLRAVLDRSEAEYERESALDRLIELLHQQGRQAESRALLLAEHARQEQRRAPPAETVQRLTPKVGRNDPCPCGSGKKHKKCCLS